MTMLVVIFSTTVALSQINTTTNQQVKLNLMKVQNEKGLCLKITDKHVLSVMKDECEKIPQVTY